MKLRGCAFALVAVLGCKGGDTGMEKPAKQASADKAPDKKEAVSSGSGTAPVKAATPAIAPAINKAGLLVADPKPFAIGALVWIDEKGMLSTAKAGDDWRKPPAVRTPMPNAEELHKALGIMTNASADDPPPPLLDDDEETGGTGTAMVLEEGKMGKKESDRDESQYRMKRPETILGARGYGTGEGVGGRGHTVGARGVLVEKLTEEPAVFAAPAAPAMVVAKVLEATGGALVVTHEDKVGVLALAFSKRLGYRGSGDWIELHLTGDGVRLIEAEKGAGRVQAIAHKAGAVDRSGIAGALGKTSFPVGPDVEIDVVAGEGSTAQQLVDLLLALDDNSARRIALGAMQGAAKDREAAVARVAPLGRRSSIPSVAIGSPSSAGDLDKAIIRRYIRRNIAKISYCYEKELIAKPAISGTVSAQFNIGADGKVTACAASGVDPEVARCVKEVIRGIEFPRPKTGTVEVSYPFMFRPAGD